MANRWFSYDPEGYGIEFWDTARKARDRANEILDTERYLSSEGWSDTITQVCWGKVAEVARVVSSRTRTAYDDVDLSIDKIVDYSLLPPWLSVGGSNG
jgi:hypothetical protein